MEYRDIALVEGTEIRCFRYRTAEGVRKAYTSITLPSGERYFASKRAETQLFKHLDLSVQALASRDWPIRDVLIKEALQRRLSSNKPAVILRTADSHVYAVVTEVFVPIPQRELENIAEKAIRDRGHNFFSEFIRLPTRMIRRYSFIDGHELQEGFYFQNSTKGLASVTLGYYYRILICSNGLMGTEEKVVFSHVHRGKKEEILLAFETCLAELLDSLKPLNVDRAKDLEIPEWHLWLEEQDIPQKYKDLTFDYLIDMHPDRVTRWDMSNAISRVAQQAPPTRRVDLERLALNLLKEV